MYARYVRNHFSWSKNFLFGRGITELARNALFLKGGTLTNSAKVASERRNVRNKQKLAIKAQERAVNQS